MTLADPALNEEENLIDEQRKGTKMLILISVSLSELL